MSLYVDSSALLKRYVQEPESDEAEQLLLADPVWVTGRHTWVEIRRNLARLLHGRSLATARQQFERDWKRTHVVEIDEHTCKLAADLAEISGLRTLDALHLAALRRVGGQGLTLITFDIRQAQAARQLGVGVVGI